MSNAVEAITTRAVTSKMCEIKDPKTGTRSHDPRFKLVHLAKDLYYALEKDVSAVSEAGRRPA